MTGSHGMAPTDSRDLRAGQSPDHALAPLYPEHQRHDGDDGEVALWDDWTQSVRTATGAAAPVLPTRVTHDPDADADAAYVHLTGDT